MSMKVFYGFNTLTLIKSNDKLKLINLDIDDFYQIHGSGIGKTVETPAIANATDRNTAHLFFVGATARGRPVFALAKLMIYIDD